MRDIILIGAGGFVGSAILEEALGRGFHVKGVVRNPDNIKVESENFTPVKADVMDSEKLVGVLEGSEAVISAFNPGWSNPDIYDETLKGYASIIKGVKSSGILRFQMVGGAGSLFVSPGVTLISSGEVPKKLLPGVESLAKVFTDLLIQEKILDWVYFSPAANLYPGKKTGHYRLGRDNLIVDENGESEISVQDYAKAMIDELENPQHHRERFTIGY